MRRMFGISMILGSLIVVGFNGTGYAALSMDEVRYLYEKETGRLWSNATPEEMRVFLADIQGREELKEVVEYKGKSKVDIKEPIAVEATTLSEQQKEKAPFHVRESYEQQTGQRWEDATEKEQDNFWKGFRRQEAAREREEKAQQRNLEREEAMRRRERLMEEKELARKRKMREMEERKKQKEKERERLEEKRKLDEARRKLERMRTESKSRR